MSDTIRLHHFLPKSWANGPGPRAVLWTQGCTLGCLGCFNPETHDNQGAPIPVQDLVEKILEQGKEIEGITISGGEPLQQRQAVLVLLEQIKSETDLTVLLFTGYRWEEVQDFPESNQLLANLDVLIAGRYIEGQRVASGLLGSANKTIHLLSNRYTREDLDAVPPAELIIGPDGTIEATGIDPLKW